MCPNYCLEVSRKLFRSFEAVCVCQTHVTVKCFKDILEKLKHLMTLMTLYNKPAIVKNKKSLTSSILNVMTA